MPLSSDETLDARDRLELWLARGYWGIRGRNRMRLKLRSGDRVAFYGAGVGVLASARIRSPATEQLDRNQWPEPRSPEPDVYALQVDDVRWINPPVRVEHHLDQLLIMENRHPRARRGWAWLVNTIRKIPDADYQTLTGA